ncbi:hypothetical protein RRG08_000341 [Elysia crispata]|uniref:Uncharacterized protein n=1 Tax=Elysia crispata TaxID=231223 RepID=A0AAE1DKZ0_9GAST|nr:hypothetical protein RRG08_000341 [Elysia crispata]
MEIDLDTNVCTLSESRTERRFNSDDPDCPASSTANWRGAWTPHYGRRAGALRRFSHCPGALNDLSYWDIR